MRKIKKNLKHEKSKNERRKQKHVIKIYQKFRENFVKSLLFINFYISFE